MRQPHGIPLIIRAAMAECLHKDPEDSLYLEPLTLPPPGFQAKARLAADALVSCLISDLDQNAREQMGHLALLGEVFSFEAGLAILNNRPELLNLYIEHQIIAPALGQPQPLLTTNSIKRPPLAFTHTLLHEHLSSQPQDHHIETLLDTLESGVPLFSIHPLLRAAEAPECYAERALQLLVAYTELLADSINRGLATPVYNAAVLLYQQHHSSMSDKSQLDIRLSLLRLRLQLTAHIPDHPDFVSTLQQFLESTETADSIVLAKHRLAALEYSTFLTNVDQEENLRDALDESEQLIQTFPALMTHRRYSPASWCFGKGSPFHIQGLLSSSRFVNGLICSSNTSSELITPEIRRDVLAWVAGELLPIFSTPEELEERKELASLIQDEFGDNPKEGVLSTQWIQFLEASGNVLSARKALQTNLAHPLKRS